MMTNLAFIFEWWAFILVLGLIFYYPSSILFKNFFDKGYFFSKILGLLVTSYITFLLSSAHILPLTRINIGIATLIAAGIFLIIPRIYFGRKYFTKINLKLLFAEELFFLLAFVCWAFVRSHNPDIHNIEKFMDYGILNSVLRTEFLPSKDIWLSPFNINYYYYGHFITGFITKFLNTPPQVAFNLMLSLIFAFTITTSFSIGANLIRSFDRNLKRIALGGVIASFLVTLSGNLQTIYAFFRSYGENPVPFWQLPFQLNLFPNGYWYPSATRFISYTIHEFPSYAFSLSDLHAHLLGTPVAILGIGILITAFLRKDEILKKSFIVFPATLGFLLAIMYMTNSLDLAIYFFLSSMIFFFVLLKGRKINIANFLIYLTIMMAGFAIFSLPFSLNFKPFVSGIGLLCPPEFLINIKSLGPLVFEEAHCQRSPIWQLGILYGFFFFWLTSLIIFLYKKKKLIADQLAIIIFFSSILLIIFPEFFYFKDIYPLHFRANTMFKMSYQVFILLSIFSAYSMVRIFTGLTLGTRKRKLLILPWIVAAVTLIGLVSIYPYFSINSSHDNLKKVKGLDGITYLKESYPYDYEAISWLNKNVKKQPIILEGQGDPYSDYARVSSNTGLPTLIGWPAHEWLWRGSYDIPGQRVEIVRKLYESDDDRDTSRILKQFKVEYVYIGGLERKKYSIKELKFLKLGKVVYKNPEVTIYKLN